MLKQSPVQIRNKPTWLFSMIALTTALMVCGLRLSGTSEALAGDVPQEDQIGFASLDHVSSHSASVNIFRPAALMNDLGVKKLLDKTPLLGEGINKQNEVFENLIGVEFAGIDQITICQSRPGSENSHNYVVVRTVEPADDKFREAADRVENRSEGDFLFNDDVGQSAQFREGVVISDNTVIWASESESLQFAIEVKENDAKATDWYGLWKKAGMEPFIYLGERELLQELGESISQNPSTSHVIKPQHIEDLQAANALAMTADFDGKFRFKILLEYEESSQADQALDSAKDVADMALAMVNVMTRAAQGPERMFLKAGLDAMTNLTLDSKGDTMIAETKFELDTEMVNEMTNDVRAAARRTQSANNVRQMTLAMHNFHDANGHFPPAVIVHESGKAHSWRIAMLPYLERQDIYDRYRFNEDWDSPHNMEVTREMPEFFRHPEAEGKSNQTNYFAVVGEGTLWGSGAPVNLAQVTDGSHSTIMFVESAQGAHWAQPIELNLEDVMAGSVGGLSEGGFNASMADGSVQFIPNSISDEHLRALFSMDAGDAIQDDE